MKERGFALLRRALSLLLLLGLLLAPTASALTTPQLKDLLETYYLDPLSDAVLSASTMEDVLQALGDPYTDYFSEEEYAAFWSSLADTELAGIGVAVSGVPEGLEIVEVYEGYAAAEAGLLAGDVIVKVGDTSLGGQVRELGVELLRGPVGSEVRLAVLRADGTQKEFTLRRALVVVPTAQAKPMTDNRISISVRAYGEDSFAHMKDILTKNTAADSFVIDQRGNPGGDADVVSQVLGLFLGRGEMTYMRDGQGRYVSIESKQEALTNKPVIVLMDGNSASAAEIFGGAMGGSYPALLLGERSYGKGIAQIFLDESSYPDYFLEGDALKVTAYRYFLSASGSSPDGLGLLPHLYLPSQAAPVVAQLLLPKMPAVTDKAKLLRLTVNEKNVWYINLEKALAAENAAYFTLLLEAISPRMQLARAGADGSFAAVTPAALAAELGLKDYESRLFTDLAGRAEADKLNILASYFILRGDESQFRPDAGLSRAELAALLSQALGLSLAGEGESFRDVAESDWFAESVQGVVAAGLMQGKGEGSFAPDAKLSNEELITVLGRLTSQINDDAFTAMRQWESAPQTAEVSQGFAPWAKPFVWLLSQGAGNMKSKPGNLLYAAPEAIAPQAAATRAQAGVLIYNIFDAAGVLPQ